MSLNPPSDIEGIGPSISAELTAYGVGSIAELLAIPVHRHAQLVQQITGISESLLGQNFLPAALWISIGADAQTAEGLALAGFRSLVSLATSSTIGILSALEEQRKAGVISEVLPAAEIDSLKQEATLRIGTGALVIRVVDHTSQPVAGATVTAVGIGTEIYTATRKNVTNSDGKVFLDMLPPGERVLRVNSQGFRTTTITALVVKDTTRLVGTSIQSGVGGDISVDEYAAGLTPSPSSGQLTLRTETVDRGDLPFRPPVYLKEIDGDKAVLISLLRRRLNEEIVQQRMRVPLNQIPADAKQFDVLVANDRDTGWATSEFKNPKEYRSQLTRLRLAEGGF